MKKSIPVLFALVLAATASISRAQKPALTQNTDEKGRTPYQLSITAGSNSVSQSVVSFPLVPQGFRLVLTNISGQFAYKPVSNSMPFATLVGNVPIPTDSSSDAPIYFLKSELASNSGGPGYTIDGPGYSYFIVNTPVLAYFNAGQHGAVFFGGGNSPTGTFTISGYLIANP